MRALIVLFLVAVAEGCDPLWSVRSTGSIYLRPDEQMVREALREDELVVETKAGDGHITALLNVPFDETQPAKGSWIGVTITRKATYELVLEFKIGDIGFGVPKGVEEKWQPILDGLRDRVLARCNEQMMGLQPSELD